MTAFQRIKNILSAIFMIMLCMIMIVMGEKGFQIIMLILAVSLALSGIRSMRYYFTMARHMVGGRGALVRSIITLDLGIFTLTMLDNPGLIMVCYIIGSYALAGGIDILRAREARKSEAPSWKISMVSGIINLLMAGGSLLFGVLPGSMKIVVYFYCATLLFTAVVRFVAAFRRTAMVYIA